MYGACCACDPSVHLSMPSIVLFVFWYSSFKSWITVTLLMLFLCVILHTMWSGKSLQLLCILPFGMLCLSAIIMMFVKIMLVGIGGLSESGLCIFRELCLVSFLVVGESQSVLL